MGREAVSKSGGPGKDLAKARRQQASVAVAAVCGLGLGVSLYFWNRLKRTSPKFCRKKSFVIDKTHVDLLRKYQAQCCLPQEQLDLLIQEFLGQMKTGLGKEGAFAYTFSLPFFPVTVSDFLFSF